MIRTRPDASADVTVLIPSIRHDQWLDLSVLSALTADQHVSVLVIFDGASPDVRAEWMSDPRVETIQLERRGGLAAALNTGLRSARTEFVARLDADDICLPGRFHRQAEALRARPNMLLISGSAQTIDESGTLIGRLSTRSGTTSWDMRRDLLLRNEIIHPAVTLRRDAVLAAGGYNESLPFMEDYELWLRLAIHGEIAMSATEEVQYRIHDAQMTKAAPPTGTHIDAILAARRRLARAIGVSPAHQRFNDLAWISSQRLRYARAAVRRHSSTA